MNGNDDRCKISGLKRYACAHCQPPKICGAKTYHGNFCTNYAGKNTPHLGTGRCWQHDYQGQKLIPHASKKLVGSHGYCRSPYEKYAMEELDGNPDVQSYQYECLDIPYTSSRYLRTYKPDFSVIYSDGKAWIIEIKSILDTLFSEENYFKFKSAEDYANRNGMHFVIWVYDRGKRKTWSWEEFRGMAPSFATVSENLISTIQEKTQTSKTKTLIRKGPQT